MSRKRAGASRRWLFRAVVFVVPWLALLGLELSLRLAGYGVPMDFVLREQVDGEPRLVSNPCFTWLFFEPNVARLVPPFSLRVAKPPGACRVFVLGSSAAQGDPEPGFGIARMLDVLLREQYPGVEFEVVNAATTAINSHVVYSMAREAAALEPDLFVVYAGNNEVVGPFGAGTVLSASAPSLTVLRAGVVLRSTRIGQLLRSAVRGVTGRVGLGREQTSWRGMEMFLEHPLGVSDPRLERTYRQYEANLTDTCRVARRAGVPIVLSTLAVNLRSCAPFGSLHGRTLSRDEGLRWDELYQEGARFQKEGRWEDAVARFRRAIEIDDGHAELQYRLGRCEWNLGRYPEAREHDRRALDLDSLRFRADTRINEVVRQVAGREAAGGRVRLADAARWFEEQAPHGIPGEEEFLDHVHLTFAGNYRLSLALLEQIREVLPDRVRAKGSGRPVLSEQECAQRLVFTELDRYMLAETMLKRIQQPPFTGQMDHAEQVERFSREIDGLRAHGESGAVAAAVQEYEKALAGERPAWQVRERYATIQRRIGNAGAAEREWRRLASQFPQYPSFHLQLARALRDAGRYADAEASLRMVLKYQPDSSLALAELARLAILQGRASEGVGYARRAVVLDPRDPNALYVLATSLCHQEPCRLEDRAEAIDHLTRSLELAPDSEPVRRDLARAQVRQAQDLLARGEPAKAVSLLERALALKPDQADARETLERARRALDAPRGH